MLVEIGLTLAALKVWLIIFWAVWFSIVFITNVFDGLKVMGRLSPRWNFASGNYDLIVQAVSIYPGSPRWLSGFLFGGVILWQALATALLWAAVLACYLTGLRCLELVNAAFALSLAHWMAFMVADELWRQWELQRAHMLAFICQLGSLLVIHFL